jgi:titin
MTGFEVWVDDGAGTFTSASAFASPGPAASSTTLTSLAMGTVYGIRMKAVNLVGPGEYSDTVYLVCADRPTAPDAPSAESSTRSSITLGRNAPSDGQSPITGYRIYMNALAVGDWLLIYAGEGYPTRQTYSAQGLSEGSQYRFMISAFNLVGESANSTEAQYTASDLPGGPTQPKLVSSTSTEVVISWEPPSDSGGQSLTAYEVQHKLATEAESAWAAITTITDINVHSFTHTGLSASADV